MRIEEAGSGLPLARLRLRRDDAQLRHFERLQFHLDRGELLAEARSLDQRRAADRSSPRQARGCGAALLRDADARDADALVAEQVFGVVPALVFLADEILDRHAHVVEEDLVDLVAAVDRDRSGAR